MNKSNFLQIQMRKFYNSFLFLFLMVIISSMPVLFGKGSTQYADYSADANEKDTPFIKAIKSKDIHKVRSLIKSGIDVNEVYKGGRTALMVAVSKDNLEIIKLLIEAGADLESYDNDGNTPLMYAFFDNEKDAVVKFLLTKNVNLEGMNNQEQTPLILAALNNHCKSIELLIRAQVKIEKKGHLGRTALMHAVDRNCVEAVKLLIKNKANIEARDVFTFTPLLVSVFNNNGAMIRILLKAGADSNTGTNITISVGKSSFSSGITIWAGEKDFGHDFFNKAMPSIPKGSKALDIAKQFQCRLAEDLLNNNTKS